MKLTAGRCRASLVLAIFLMAHLAASIGHVHTHAPCDLAAHGGSCAHHHDVLEHESAETPADEQQPTSDADCAVCQFLAHTTSPPVTLVVDDRPEPLAEQVTAEPFFISPPTAREYQSRAPPRLA